MRFKKYYENIFKPVSVEDLALRREKYSTMRFEEWMDEHGDMLRLNEDGTYDSNVGLNFSFMALKKIPIKFNKVYSDFDVTSNFLTDLEGSPSYVGGGFFASANQLETMKGGPEVVNGPFYVNHNKLTSLEGGPKEVNGSYSIVDNPGPEGNGFTEEAVKATRDATRDWDKTYDITI